VQRVGDHDEIDAPIRERGVFRGPVDALEEAVVAEKPFGGPAHLSVRLDPEHRVAVLQEQHAERPRAGADVRHDRVAAKSAPLFEEAQDLPRIPRPVPGVILGPVRKARLGILHLRTSLATRRYHYNLSKCTNRGITYSQECVEGGFSELRP
jgi:hypothetical protein